jgi:hypothetical protein
MSERSPSIRRTIVLAASIIVATGGSAAVGHTQQITGAIDVSLVILQPVASQPVRVTGFAVGSDGMAHLETTVPTSARTSQVVMTRVASSFTGFAPEPQPPTLVPPSSANSRLRCHVRAFVIPSARSESKDLHPTASAPPIQLRVEYLTVAGT